MDNQELIIGDNLLELPKLKDGYVKAFVTSPPYKDARDYQGFPSLTLSRIRKLAKLFYSKLTPDGVLCWNVNDMSDGRGGETLDSLRQALIFQKAGFSVKPIIWKKSVFNPGGNFYYDVKEYIWVCFKNQHFTFNPIHDIKKSENYQYLGEFSSRKKDGSFKKTKKDQYIQGYREKQITEPFRKRDNVWEGNTAGQEYPCQKTWGHAPMPEWLARDLIISFTNEGDVVCDPFSGGGTTWKMARQLGRKFIGIEIGKDIAEESRIRLSHVNPVLF